MNLRTLYLQTSLSAIGRSALKGRKLFDRLSDLSDDILLGDPVYGNQNESPPLARSFENRKPSDKLLGIATVNVFDIDLSKRSIPPFSVQSGGKISILTVGEIVIYKKYKKIPFGQPMYISKKGNITWRNHGDRIGTTSSNQDKDGFLKVSIKIKGY